MSSGNELLELTDALTEGRGALGFREMSDYDLYESIEQIRWHYENWSPPPLRDQELRVHPATIGVRGMHSFPIEAIRVTDEEMRKRTGTVEPWASTLRTLRRVASGALLYADTVVEIDPLSLSVEDGYTHEPEEAIILRDRLVRGAGHLKLLEPLIEAGVLILVPDPGEPHWIDKDLIAAENVLRESGATCDAVLERAKGVAAALFDLRVAALADAMILGIDERSWREIALVMAPMGPAGDRHVSVAAGLGFANLPFLAGISTETVLRIREDEDAFVEWRANLRNAAGLIRYSPEEAGFRREAAAVFEDYLRPNAAAVRRAVSRSASLKRAVCGEPIKMAFGAAMTAGVTAVSGMPISGVIIGALGGTVGGIASSVLRPRIPDGERRVFYELLR